jgi:serine/threonine protein kinase
MSPEVWRQQPYSYGCDVWSLGCALYTMASLKAPFEGSILDVRAQVCAHAWALGGGREG